MILALAAALFIVPPGTAKILFLGNSHTSNHDVPKMVKNLLLSDKAHRQVETQVILGGHLEDIYNNAVTLPAIRNGRFTHVVLQAQKISMSHQFDYSKKEGIMLAKEAERYGARAIFFSEWPRRGIDETRYIYNIYAGMANKSGAEVAATGHAWDMALQREPKLELWATDGNHSALPGAYLAALTIYFVIAGPQSSPAWRPVSIDAGTARMFAALARKPKVD